MDPGVRCDLAIYPRLASHREERFEPSIGMVAGRVRPETKIANFANFANMYGARPGNRAGDREASCYASPTPDAWLGFTVVRR